MLAAEETARELLAIRQGVPNQAVLFVSDYQGAWGVGWDGKRAGAAGGLFFGLVLGWPATRRSGTALCLRLHRVLRRGEGRHSRPDPRRRRSGPFGSANPSLLADGGLGAAKPWCRAGAPTPDGASCARESLPPIARTGLKTRPRRFRTISEQEFGNVELELNDLGTLRGQDGVRAGRLEDLDGFYLEPEKEATMEHSSRMRA